VSKSDSSKFNITKLKANNVQLGDGNTLNVSNAKSKSRTYSLFISHAWTFHADYHRLLGFLESAPNFEFRNLSVPRDDVLLKNVSNAPPRLLEGALEAQIRASNCVLVIAGLYAAHREWMLLELELAQSHAKSVIALLFDEQEQLPQIMQDIVSVTVQWNAQKIADAIRRYAT
jgi:MTH538 TIR-like domain (DUF1863)